MRDLVEKPWIAHAEFQVCKMDVWLMSLFLHLRMAQLKASWMSEDVFCTAMAFYYI